MIDRSDHDRYRHPSLSHEVSADGYFTRLYHQHVGCRIDVGLISHTSDVPRFKASAGRSLSIDELRQVIRYMEIHERLGNEPR